MSEVEILKEIVIQLKCLIAIGVAMLILYFVGNS